MRSSRRGPPTPVRLRRRLPRPGYARNLFLLSPPPASRVRSLFHERSVVISPTLHNAVGDAVVPILPAFAKYSAGYSARPSAYRKRQLRANSSSYAAALRGARLPKSSSTVRSTSDTLSATASDCAL